MTEPREPQAGTVPDLEVRPEVISDLDLPDDDAINIAGGCEPSRLAGQER